MALHFKNLLANYSGQVWTGIASLSCIPFYISLLGLEQYAFIGLFALMQSFLPLFDLGLGNTLIREVSHQSDDDQKSFDSQGDLLRTVEISTLILALIIFVVFQFFASYISSFLVANTHNLNLYQLNTIIRLMGCALSLKLYETVYRNMLIGQRKHLLQNILHIIRVTFSTFGVLLFLYVFSATINAYILCQIFISIAFIFLHGLYIYHPKYIHFFRYRFSFSWILRVRHYTTGIALISLIGIIFSQFDKLVLIRLMPLEDFSIYSIAFSLASSLTLLVSPISISYFPLFCTYLSSKSRKQLISSFHFSSQLVASVSSSLAFTLVSFSYPILLLWSRNENIASNGSPILSLLSIAILLISLVVMPGQLQLAYGWTKMGLRTNILLLFFFIPSSIFLTASFGSIGAASSLVLLNLSVLLLNVSQMFAKIFKTQWRIWLISDTLSPCFASFLSALISSYFFLLVYNTFPFLAFFLPFSVLCVFCLSFLVSGLSSSRLRPFIFKLFRLFPSLFYC